MAVDQQTATLSDLARRAERERLGKYRATVFKNNDPKKRGRLRLIVPSVFGKDNPTDWVPGAFPIASSSGEAFIMIPAENSHVLVEFIEGDVSSPVWTAAYYPEKPAEVPVPPEFDLDQGQLHLLRTRKGLTLRLEDDGDKKQVLVIKHPGGGEVRIDEEGITTIKDKGGATVLMDPKAKVTKIKGHGDGLLEMKDGATTLAHGSVKLELTSSGITATGGMIALKSSNVLVGDGAASPILDTAEFAKIFDAHTHVATSFGAPSGPPVPLLAPAIVAASLKKVKGA